MNKLLGKEDITFVNTFYVTPSKPHEQTFRDSGSQYPQSTNLNRYTYCRHPHDYEE